MTEHGRIVETPDDFIFDLDDFDSTSFDRRKVGDGVNIFTTSTFALIARIAFTKEKWDFEGVTQWLQRNFGIEVSDDRTAKLQLEEGRFYAPQIEAPYAIREVPLEGDATLLLMRAVPITPGEHKGFKFTRDVILGAAHMFENTNLVEHHHFEVPAHVVGTILAVAKNEEDENIIVTSVITKPSTIEKVKNKHFHSVSVSFFLKADDDKNVTRITEIEELTLTDHPADPNAVVIDFKDIQIPVLMSSHLKDCPRDHPPGTSCPKKLEEMIGEMRTGATLTLTSEGATLTNSKSLATPKIPTLYSSNEKGGTKLENEPKAEAPPTSTVDLESRLTKLESDLQISQKERKMLADTVEKQNLEMRTQANLQLVFKAESDVKTFLDEQRINEAQTSICKQMLVAFSKDHRTLFEEFLKLQSIGVLGSERDIGMVANYPLALSELTDEQLGLLSMADSQDGWEQAGGPGTTPEDQRKHSQNMYATSWQEEEQN